MTAGGAGLGVEGCQYHTQSHSGTNFVWAIMCGTYLIFLLIQMPRVNWETVVVPLVELLCYLMRWSGNGYVQLGVNVYMPWVNYSSWLMTTPALLFQIQDIVGRHIKIHKLRMAPLQSLLNVLMLMSGITASLISSNGFKLLLYALGCIVHILIMMMSCFHFNEGIRRFQESGIEIFTSWTAYPCLWLLSSQGLCIVADNILDECYLVADVLSKAVFGLTMWHTKTKILKGHWEIERYVERKKNKIHYKLLGNTHKEPDYGEDDVEDRALRRRRRVHMSNAQQCFQLADACIRQAELCLAQASNDNDELLRSAFLGDHYLRKVTPRYRRIDQGAREWKVLGRTHDQRREKYMFPIKKELKRHPMKPTLLECVDDISFPMAFNQANSTLEDEADEKALEFDRCTSDPNMDSVLPTLQESVARFGLHNLRRDGPTSAQSFDTKPCPLEESEDSILPVGRSEVSSDRSAGEDNLYSGPIVGRHLGDMPDAMMSSCRRDALPRTTRDASASDVEDLWNCVSEGSPAMLEICRELGSLSSNDPSIFPSEAISVLRKSIQKRRSKIIQASPSESSRTSREKETKRAAAATSAGNLADEDTGAVRGAVTNLTTDGEARLMRAFEADPAKHVDSGFEVVIDIQQQIERVNAVLNSQGGTGDFAGGGETVDDIQEQISAVNALLAAIDTNLYSANSLHEAAARIHKE